MGSLANLVLTITNVATKVLFLLQMAQLSDHAAYLSAQICILVASHGCGGAIIAWLLRSQLRMAEAEAGCELLDVESFQEHASMYALLLIVASGNLQVLMLLPWRHRGFAGLPSVGVLRCSYLSMLCTDLPQICLQASFTLLREPSSSITISIVSIVCSGIGIAYRLVGFWLKIIFSRVVQIRRYRRQRQAEVRSNVNALPADVGVAAARGEPLLEPGLEQE